MLDSNWCRKSLQKDHRRRSCIAAMKINEQTDERIGLMSGFAAKKVYFT